MKTRVITAVILLPILLAVVLAAPKLLTAVLFGAMAAIGAYELLYRTGLVRHIRLVAYSAVLAFLISLWSFYGMSRTAGILGLLVYFILLFGEMMASHVKIRFEQLAMCMAAGIVIPFLLTSLVRIHTMYNGRHMILVPFIIAMLSDTGAYFAGRALGRHKLAPVISPNKTIEGVAGGVLAAVAGMLIYALILDLAFDFQVQYGYAVIYALLGSAAGVFGDLCFSTIKRQTGIKDYGNLIPGHGGILDRFDSMMLVSPLTEALLLMIPLAV